MGSSTAEIPEVRWSKPEPSAEDILAQAQPVETKAAPPAPLPRCPQKGCTGHLHEEGRIGLPATDAKTEASRVLARCDKCRATIRWVDDGTATIGRRMKRRFGVRDKRSLYKRITPS